MRYLLADGHACALSKQMFASFRDRRMCLRGVRRSAGSNASPRNGGATCRDAYLIGLEQSLDGGKCAPWPVRFELTSGLGKQKAYCSMRTGPSVRRPPVGKKCLCHSRDGRNIGRKKTGGVIWCASAAPFSPRAVLRPRIQKHWHALQSGSASCRSMHKIHPRRPVCSTASTAAPNTRSAS